MRSVVGWILGIIAGVAVVDSMPDGMFLVSIPVGAVVLGTVVTLIDIGPRAFLRMVRRRVRPPS